MQIWVDADACPREVKELLYKSAKRTETRVTFVANQKLHVPKSEFLQCIIVPAGPDVADQRIVQLMEAGDLVITADIPLASSVVSRGGEALDPRGEMLTEDNIAERLSIRNLLDDMRGAGAEIGGPSQYSAKQRQQFANHLDRWLTAKRKQSPG